LKAGATTVWEHWDGKKPDGTMWSPDMNSFNHYAYGAIGEWLYRVVAGIEADEYNAGYRHTIINPHVGGGLEYVKANYASVYGDVTVEWRVQGDSVVLDIAVPHNTTATVVLNDAKVVAGNSGVPFIKKENGYAANIGSGKYQFRYTI
jgi:alpha-L-rhamnosidase